MTQAIILAAGESKRMGFPKALLEFDGEKAIEKILRCCRESGIEKPIVVLGAHAERIEKEAKLGPAQIVVNAGWSAGQTSSVKAGAQALSPTAKDFLVWPVDLPLVPLEVLRDLLAATPESSSKSIFVPSFQGRRGHPVRFTASLREEVLKLSNEIPLHAVLRRDPDRIQEVPVMSETVLRDFDRPEDLPPTRPA